MCSGDRSKPCLYRQFWNLLVLPGEQQRGWLVLTSSINGGSSAMRSKLLFVTLTATSVLAVPVAAYAQGQTDSQGNAMGSQHVKKANRHVTHSTSHQMHSGTVGANMGTHR